MAQTGGFMEKFEFKIMPIVYGLGAAVVIIGALFKIMHWPGADAMLILGLGTEAVIFACSAFLPPHRDPNWSKVYPQLAEEDEDYGDEPSSENLTKSMDNMLADANINSDVIQRLGKGLNNLSDNVSKMKDLSDASVATGDYTKNVQAATKSVQDLSKSYASTAEAMGSMAAASADAKEYHGQVQAITKNLGALNAVYEMELQDANNHLKAMNKFYGNLSSAMESMSSASKDSEKFKTELTKLSSNLTQLNSVYGNMLSAMKGGSAASEAK